MSINRFKYNQGFTLVELVTVMIILGIMSVVVGAKFFDNSTFKDTQYHQEILSAFRYAQKIAIASRCDIVITLGANNYSISYSGNSGGTSCSGFVQHPAGRGNYSDTGTSLITPTPVYTYNSQGIATSTGAYSFSVGGHNITIEPITGYVHE